MSCVGKISLLACFNPSHLQVHLLTSTLAGSKKTGHAVKMVRFLLKNTLFLLYSSFLTSSKKSGQVRLIIIVVAPRSGSERGEGG